MIIKTSPAGGSSPPKKTVADKAKKRSFFGNFRKLAQVQFSEMNLFSARSVLSRSLIARFSNQDDYIEWTSTPRAID